MSSPFYEGPQGARGQGLQLGKDLINSFNEASIYVKSEQPLTIGEQRLLGNLIIQSTTEIVVESSAKIEDAVLIAPKVRVLEGFKGALQIMASQQIVIETGVKLDYPSALVLCHRYITDSAEPHGIYLKGDAQVTGNLVYLHKGSSNYDTQIRVASNALVEGLIYCEQNLELRGTVKGMVATHNFIIKEQGSVYQNHLFNAKIVAKDLDPHFVGLDLGFNRREVAKCLY